MGKDEGLKEARHAQREAEEIRSSAAAELQRKKERNEAVEAASKNIEADELVMSRVASSEARRREEEARRKAFAADETKAQSQKRGATDAEEQRKEAKRKEEERKEAEMVAQ